jgi:hypothetical protein
MKPRENLQSLPSRQVPYQHCRHRLEIGTGDQRVSRQRKGRYRVPMLQIKLLDIEFEVKYDDDFLIKVDYFATSAGVLEVVVGAEGEQSVSEVNAPDPLKSDSRQLKTGMLWSEIYYFLEFQNFGSQIFAQSSFSRLILFSIVGVHSLWGVRLDYS